MNVLVIVLYSSCLLCAVLTGRIAEAGLSVMEGAKAAIEFAISIGGALCFWSAASELMEVCGASALISRFLSPLLRRLFPHGTADRNTLAALSENVSANLLGLGNAATPAGIRAAKGLAQQGQPDELCLLVVINTASIQLLPTTIAAVRAGLGAESPFDITPAVWFSSLVSLSAGLIAATILRRLRR